MEWYCLHTEPRQEAKVAHLLRRDLGLEVFAPRIRFRRLRAGRTLWTTEALFPSYLFARFDYSERRRQVNACRGVSRIVRFGDRPAPVEGAAMRELRALVHDHVTVEVQVEPQPGSEVVIAGGSLGGLRVLVTRLIPRDNASLFLFEMLGSAREVEVERQRVFPVNPRQP